MGYSDHVRQGTVPWNGGAGVNAVHQHGADDVAPDESTRNPFRDSGGVIRRGDTFRDSWFRGECHTLCSSPYSVVLKDD